MNIIISPYSQRMRNGERNPKNYPFWPELLELLKNHNILQIGRSGEEKLTKNTSFDLHYEDIEKLLQECDFWMSVDSFLPHLANHIPKKGVVLWGPSNPDIFGYPYNVNILKSRNYLRKQQFNIWEEESFVASKFVPAKEVYEIIKREFNI